MQTRGRTELGLDPNTVRHNVVATTLRVLRYVAAVEGRSYESVR